MSATSEQLAELLRKITSGAYTWRTGRCAGCGREYPEGEKHVANGVWTWPRVGTVLYTICWRCAPRLRKEKFRRRIRDEAYRSLFKAGPDDVAGSA